ncbi:MAG TPA: hypothetical protein VMN57_00030 [Anaerolineales bacterium]|nr:hypothetical protein [Anaerolineales bacterium]
MRRLITLLFLAGLVIHASIAAFQATPGYMDADYYLLGGRTLARGGGFSEDVLWNYLDDPAGLPHPSHAYWLPASSFVTAAALVFDPEGGFALARWAFVLVAALVPPLVAVLAHRLYSHLPPNRRLWNAGLAGALALFPGYTIGFLTTTDSFGLYMVLGAVFFLAISSGARDARRAAVLGAVAGLMQLTRTDGFVWLAAAAIVLFREDRRNLVPLFLAFLAVLAPWLIRNQAEFGSPLAPGGSRALWWTEYDDLFAYPAEILTPARWLASGALAILAARLEAAGRNLVSAFAVGGLTFLFPLILAGFARLRRSPAVQTAAAGWVLLFLVMSFVFPFAGSRGGYFHAAAALQPLFWALVPEGLAAFTEWGGRVRGWRPAAAGRVFGAGAVVIAGLATAFLGWIRFIEPALTDPGSPHAYRLAETILTAGGAGPDEIVMVNNPPGYALQNDRPAIVIPSGGTNALHAAARAYGAGYLVLGPEQGLDEIYDRRTDQPGLIYLGDAGDLLVFRFEEAP